MNLLPMDTEDHRSITGLRLGGGTFGPIRYPSVLQWTSEEIARHKANMRLASSLRDSYKYELNTIAGGLTAGDYKTTPAGHGLAVCL